MPCCEQLLCIILYLEMFNLRILIAHVILHNSNKSHCVSRNFVVLDTSVFRGSIQFNVALHMHLYFMHKLVFGFQLRLTSCVVYLSICPSVGSGRLQRFVLEIIDPSY